MPTIFGGFEVSKLRLISHTGDDVVADDNGVARVLLGAEELAKTRLLVKVANAETNTDIGEGYAIVNPSYGVSTDAAAATEGNGPHFVITAHLPETGKKFLLKIFSNSEGGDSFSSAVTYNFSGSAAAKSKLPKVLATPAPIALLSPLSESVTVGVKTEFRVGLSPDIGGVRFANADGRQQVMDIVTSDNGDRIATTVATIAEGSKAEIIVNKKDESAWSVFTRYTVVHESGEAAKGSDSPPELFDAFKECHLRLVSHIHKEISVDDTGLVKIVIGAQDITKVRLLPKLFSEGKDLEDGLVMVNPSFGVENGDGPHFIVDVAVPAAGTYVLKLHCNSDGGESFTSAVNYTLTHKHSGSTTRFPKLFPYPCSLLEPKEEKLPADQVQFRVGVSSGVKLVQVAHPDNTRTTLPIEDSVASALVTMKPGLAKLVVQLDGQDNLTVFTKFTVA